MKRSGATNLCRRRCRLCKGDLAFIGQLFTAKGVGGALINGWQIAGVYTYLSGAPLTPLSTNNRVFTGSIFFHKIG